jgi:hypothetical protein
VPVLRNSSVLWNGPKIRLPFGLAIMPSVLPEFAGLSLLTRAVPPRTRCSTVETLYRWEFFSLATLNRWTAAAYQGSFSKLM